MSALIKCFNALKLTSSIACNVGDKLVKFAVQPKHQFLSCSRHKLLLPQVCGFHATSTRHDLMEFFDDPKNWAEQEVKVGRSWRLDELRIKSNADLHKLWYVLLKERNMLMTMEYECKESVRLFPNPERLDKVKESMDNLEAVVRERNRAYHNLETGEHGERQVKVVVGQIGLRKLYCLREHAMPRFMNKSYREKVIHRITDAGTHEFLNKYREKRHLEIRRWRRRQNNHVRKLLQRYPNLDNDLLKSRYPDAKVDSIRRNNQDKGHYVYKVD